MTSVTAHTTHDTTRIASWHYDSIDIATHERERLLPSPTRYDSTTHTLLRTDTLLREVTRREWRLRLVHDTIVQLRTDSFTRCDTVIVTRSAEGSHDSHMRWWVIIGLIAVIFAYKRLVKTT